MLTRRELLGCALGAGAVWSARSLYARASQPATPVNFEVPAGACDCHTHMYGDPAEFPLSPNRTYTPELAVPDEMRRMHHALHLQRVVIVTPSVYGTDNSTTLVGLKARGDDARGIAVIDEKTSDRELDAMHQAGVRGIRLNLAAAGTNDPGVARARFIAAAGRMQGRNWHIQINTSLAVIAALKPTVAASSVPVVFDHFGGARSALGLQQPGFADLLELVKAGKAYVKISAAYSVSKLPPDFADIVPLAQALIAAHPERILWGTNWPHPGAGQARKITEVTPHMPIDDGEMLNLLPRWAPSARMRKQILVDNPARLYQFA